MALLLALAGCGSASDGSMATIDDDHALNDAAAMLDRNSVAAEPLTTDAGQRP